MSAMKTKRAKTFNYSILLFFSLYFAVIYFPYLLFDHSVTHNEITVYTNGSVGDDLIRILDQSTLKLKESPIYDSKLSHRIFICNNYRLFGFLAPFSNNAFACNYPMFNNIFIANTNLAEDKVYRNGNGYNERQLSTVIAHEITHSLLEEHLGFIRYKMLATWKNEGYCEYVAYGKPFNQHNASSFLQLNANSSNPRIDYGRYHIATGFAISENDDLDTFLGSSSDLVDVLETIKAR